MVATGRDISMVPAGLDAIMVRSDVLPAAAVPDCSPVQGKHSNSRVLPVTGESQRIQGCDSSLLEGLAC